MQGQLHGIRVGCAQFGNLVPGDRGGVCRPFVEDAPSRRGVQVIEHRRDDRGFGITREEGIKPRRCRRIERTAKADDAVIVDDHAVAGGLEKGKRKAEGQDDLAAVAQAEILAQVRVEAGWDLSKPVGAVRLGLEPDRPAFRQEGAGEGLVGCEGKMRRFDGHPVAAGTQAAEPIERQRLHPLVDEIDDPVAVQHQLDRVLIVGAFVVPLADAIPGDRDAVGVALVEDAAASRTQRNQRPVVGQNFRQGVLVEKPKLHPEVRAAKRDQSVGIDVHRIPRRAVKGKGKAQRNQRILLDAETEIVAQVHVETQRHSSHAIAAYPIRHKPERLQIRQPGALGVRCLRADIEHPLGVGKEHHGSQAQHHQHRRQRQADQLDQKRRRLRGVVDIDDDEGDQDHDVTQVFKVVHPHRRRTERLPDRADR